MRILSLKIVHNKRTICFCLSSARWGDSAAVLGKCPLSVFLKGVVPPAGVSELGRGKEEPPVSPAPPTPDLVSTQAVTGLVRDSQMLTLPVLASIKAASASLLTCPALSLHLIIAARVWAANAEWTPCFSKASQMLLNSVASLTNQEHAVVSLCH